MYIFEEGSALTDFHIHMQCALFNDKCSYRIKNAKGN